MPITPGAGSRRKMKRPKVIYVLLSMLLKIFKLLSGFLGSTIKIPLFPVPFLLAMQQPVH